MRESRVELVKHKLILDQIYSILLVPPFSPLIQTNHKSGYRFLKEPDRHGFITTTFKPRQAILESYLVPACATKGEELAMVSLSQCHANEGKPSSTHHYRRPAV